MVFGILKNMFLGKSVNEVVAYKQGEEIGGVTLSLDEEHILLGDETISIPSIVSVTKGDKSVTITTNNCKYKLVCDKPDELHGILHPIIKPVNILYETAEFEYYVYSRDSRTFEKFPLENPLIKINEDLSSFYYLLEDESSVRHFNQITSGYQYYMDQNNRTFVWSVYHDSSFDTFSIRFPENIPFLEFMTCFVECTYKSVNKDGTESKYYEKMFVVDQSPTDNESTKESTKEEVVDDWDEFEEPEDKNNQFDNKDDQNSHLIVDDKNVFVTRGKALGIFDTDLKFKTQIKNAFDNPRKIITHNGHDNLIAQTKTDQIDLLDLQRGEVVENWKVRDMNDFFNSMKQENDGTLVGVGDYSIFRIDPRTKEKVVESKEYKMKNEFSCGVATETGDVAVASAKGDLRLYNDVSKRAKSLINGFGDPILGIDTSKNGKLVLCTCKSYILVHEVNDNYKTALGKEKKTPKRLQLKPQHLALIKSDISFTTAKFDQSDRYIVCSTGEYLIKWRVSDVIEGDVYNYRIKTLYDKVVDENFVINGDDIIVALPNDVKHVDAKGVKKPR